MKLTRRSATELAQRNQQISDRIFQQVTEIIDGVKERGEEALLDYSRRFDGRTPDEPLYLTQKEMQRFADRMKPDDRERCISFCVRPPNSPSGVNRSPTACCSK